jgi:cation-transporting ATPase E
MLTIFSALAGLALVLFVEPPSRWFVGGDRYSGDKRPTLLALGMLIVLILVLSIPQGREFFELLPLEWQDYAAIVGMLLVWMLLLRYVWRARLFERFLDIEDVVDFDEHEWRLANQ